MTPLPDPRAGPAETPAPQPLLELPDLRNQAQEWRLRGWLPERERLLGWYCQGDPMPQPLPQTLRIAGLRHVLWEVRPEGEEILPGCLHAGEEPAGTADPQRPSDPQLALLDHLATDDADVARRADALGVPVWWLGEALPAGLRPQRQFDDPPADGAGLSGPARWAAGVGPAAAMDGATHPADGRMDLLADQQQAVQATFERFQAGDAATAGEAARRLLALYPARGDLQHLLGVLARQAGDLAGAAWHFEAACRLTPGYTQAWHSLALTELGRGQLDAALRATQHALSLSPGHAGLRALHARLLQQAGHLELGATEAANALLLAPDDLGALLEHAAALNRLGQSDEALALYRRGLRQHPAALDLHFNLGVLLRQVGQADEAIAHLDQVVASTAPCDGPASDARASLHRRAIVERSRAQADCCAWLPAVADARRAHDLDPGEPEGLRLLVELERRVDHPERALLALTAAAAATALPPDLCLTQRQLQRQLDPVTAPWDDPTAAALLALVHDPRAPLPGADLLAALVRSAGSGQAWAPDSGPAASPNVATVAGALLQRSTRRVAARAAQLGALTDRDAAAGTRRARARPRLVYAFAPRPDGREAAWVQALREAHDPGCFDVWLCHWGRADGRVAGPLEQADEAQQRLIDLTGQTDLAAARHLADLGIDLLVDLEGLGPARRPTLLALRPARLQVGWLDREAGQRPPWLDALLCERGDPAIHACAEPERLLELPRPLLGPRRPAPLPGSPAHDAGRRRWGLPLRAPVLACTRPLDEFAPGQFASWMRLLQACPPAVLWLGSRPPLARQALQAAAAAAGIAAQRLHFAPWPARPEADEALALADLHLSPGPAGDAPALLQALEAGLPALSMPAGPPTQTLARLSAAGLAPADLGAVGLIAHDVQSGEQIARHWLGHPRELLTLHRRLAQAAARSPLFDLPRQVRQLEALLQELLERPPQTPDAAAAAPQIT